MLAAASLALVGLAVLMAGCAGLPMGGVSTPTHAIDDYAQTPLGAITRKAIADDGRSRFRLQPHGPYAFATRLALARCATRSVDVQYYLLQGDNAGHR